MRKKTKRVSPHSVSLASNPIQKAKLSVLSRFQKESNSPQRRKVHSFLICTHCHMISLRTIYSWRVCKNCFSLKLLVKLWLKKLASKTRIETTSYPSNEYVYHSSDLKHYFKFKDNSWGDIAGTSLKVLFSEKELSIIQHRKRVFRSVKNSSCGICFEFFKAKERYIWTLCKHLFHPLCLLYWVNINPCCPLCRSSLK